MKKILLAISVISSMVSLGYCENQPLQLTIKSDKDVYEAGEEIKLEATIKNNSDKEMIFFWSDEEPAQASGGGGTSLIITSAHLNAEKAYPIYIKPKQAIKKIISPGIAGESGPTFTLSYDSHSVILDFKHNSNQEIFISGLTSNTITIEVKEKIGDPIERLVERLSKDSMWINGIYPVIKLPSTATAEQVVSEVFKMCGFDQGHVTDYKIIQTKEVQIPGSLPDKYTAVLVQTNFGEKIVLLQYEGDAHGTWWSRVYDKDL